MVFLFYKMDGFGVGRAMMDSAQEIRNGHLTVDEGQVLIRTLRGEYHRYESEFLKYIDMQQAEFLELCDRFRSPHLWKVVEGEWALRHTPYPLNL